MSEAPPRYVTCPCQHCGSNIEFDANELGEEENISAPCPHCGLETIILVPPQQSVPPVVPSSQASVILQTAMKEYATQKETAEATRHYTAALSYLSLNPQVTPATVQGFVGQDRVRLKIGQAFEEAERKGHRPPHVLLIGPEGSGKTSFALLIARAFANSRGATYKVVNAEVINEMQNFARYLASVKERDICFIDDIDHLDSAIARYLSPVIVDFKFDVAFWLESGAHPPRSDLPHFTLIATATHKDKLSPFVLASFPVVEEFDAYSTEEITDIAGRLAKYLGLDIDDGAIELIAHLSGGTPKTLLSLLELACVYARARAVSKRITAEIASEAFKTLFPTEPSDGAGPERQAIPSEVKREVWRRDEGKCVKCGSRELLEFDHIIPVAKGGSNTVRNIELLCERCNRSKSDSIQ